MNKYLNTYEYDPAIERHTWVVVGIQGAVHLWIEKSVSRGLPKWFGGLEVHYAEKPSHCNDDLPDHEYCRLLCGPCWHDGSSLVAEEHWIPFWQDSPDDNERMFAQLRREADEIFETEADEAFAAEAAGAE